MRSRTITIAITAVLLLGSIGLSRADESADNEKLVRAFIASWTTKPIDEIVGYLDEQVTFTNIPDPKPIKGRKDAKAFLEPFFKKDPLIVPFTFKTDLKHVVANGGTVMLDRVDTITIAGKSWVVPVATLFEVKSGKIVVWTDYFDQEAFEAPAMLMETLAKKK